MTGRCLDARRTKPSYPGRSGVNPGTATGADERYAIWSRGLVYIVSSTCLNAEFPRNWPVHRHSSNRDVMKCMVREQVLLV